MATATTPAARQTFIASLRHACEAAAPLGIDILIEPINGRDMPGYFLNDFGFAAALIAELGLPNLKLQYDIYHRQILHGDVMKSLEALLPVTGHVQTASVPKRNEPGTGELDDWRIFRHLDALGYDGYVGCEYRPAAGRSTGLGWMKAAEACRLTPCGCGRPPWRRVPRAATWWPRPTSRRD